MSQHISCNTKEKAENRKLILEWIKSRFKKSRLKSLRVMCCPGWEALEIYEIWDKLGVPRSNILAITNEEFDFEELIKIEGITVALGDFDNDEFCKMLPWIAKGKVDIIYIDLYSNYSESLIENIMIYSSPLLAPDGIFGITLQIAREKDAGFKRDAWCKSTVNKGVINNSEAKLDNILIRMMMACLGIGPITFNRLVSYRNKNGSFNPSDIKPHLERAFKFKENPKVVKKVLKSKYVVKNKIPMGTVLCKTAQLSKNHGLKKAIDIFFNQIRLVNDPVNYINNCQKSAVIDVKIEERNIRGIFDRFLHPDTTPGIDYNGIDRDMWLEYYGFKISQSFLSLISMGHDLIVVKIVYDYFDRAEELVCKIFHHVADLVLPTLRESEKPEILLGRFFILQENGNINIVSREAIDKVAEMVNSKPVNKLVVDSSRPLMILNDRYGFKDINHPASEELSTESVEKDIPDVVAHMLLYPDESDENLIDKYQVSKRSLAAYKAHITMGRYNKYL